MNISKVLKTFKFNMSDCIGLVGTILILLTYWLLTNGKINGTDLSYLTMTALGCTCVGINCTVKKAWGALALQLAVFIMSLIAIAKGVL